MTTALTERQQEILDVIANHTRKYGYPPTIRDIGARTGITSSNGVNDHLQALERKGYIERDRYAARGIRLVGPALLHTCSHCGQAVPAGGE